MAARGDASEPIRAAGALQHGFQLPGGAFEEEADNDYSARTTWGVFNIFNADNSKVLQALIKGKKRHEVQRFHVILLEAWRGKVPFSAFKRIVQEAFKGYGPDRLLIEKKASGHSLIQELRKGSLPVKRSIRIRARNLEPTLQRFRSSRAACGTCTATGCSQ